jgi:hypothetical protein
MPHDSADQAGSEAATLGLGLDNATSLSTGSTTSIAPFTGLMVDRLAPFQLRLPTPYPSTPLHRDHDNPRLTLAGLDGVSAEEQRATLRLIAANWTRAAAGCGRRMCGRSDT